MVCGRIYIMKVACGHTYNINSMGGRTYIMKVACGHTYNINSMGGLWPHLYHEGGLWPYL